MQLKETYPEKMQVEESAGNLILRFKFLTQGIPSGNNRVYKATTIANALKAANEAIRRQGPSYGTIGHQDKPELDAVSHLCTDFSVDENGNGWCTAKILDTKAGKNLQAIIKGGGKIGVSPRGHGSTSKNEKGQEVVGDDYRLDAVDMVLNPSFDNNWVGQEQRIFEGLSVNDEQMDIALVRFQAACRAGYKGEFQNYLNEVYRPYVEAKKVEEKVRLDEAKKEVGALHQASLDRVAKNPEQAPGFPKPYPGDPTKDGGPEDEHLAAVKLLESAVDKQVGPNIWLHDFDDDNFTLFDLNKSEFFEMKYERAADGSIQIKRS